MDMRKHVKISNKAFSSLTGIKWVCMDCGQNNRNADRECPGPSPRADFIDDSREIVRRVDR